MKIVGVTSCIAGLAHTPLAAKAMTKASEKLGHEAKFEQQGAMGTVNGLTEKEIADADIVIIASDKTIEGEERFGGKRVVRVKISQCVTNAEAVLKKIMEIMENKNREER